MTKRKCFICKKKEATKEVIRKKTTYGKPKGDFGLQCVVMRMKKVWLCEDCFKATRSEPEEAKR